MKLTERQKECIKSEFKKLNLPDKCYPLYAKHFSEWMVETLENDKIDMSGDPNSVSVEDEDFTAAYLLETTVEHCRDLINSFNTLLTQGYSESFAETYIEEALNVSDNIKAICDDSFRSALGKVGNWDTDPSNPAYLEVFRVAKKNGHTDIYSHQLSSLVVEEVPLSKALKTAELYETTYNECIESGFSEPYSRIYAKEYSSDLRKDAEIARVYAKCYEIKINEGLPHNSAWCFADNYVDGWINYGDEAFIGENFNEDLLPTAEAKSRYRHNDRYSEFEYILLFEAEFHNIRHREKISRSDASTHAHTCTEERLISRKQ